eukprot:GHVT01082761.1.p1 GENE.GHVT01082761.1~~GHVT01082761.1.p1  ORF type:complete len:571 (-),score=10.94 GHVT01082761.1:249-1961(-)
MSKTASLPHKGKFNIPEQTDVFIVGAGPSGLCLSLELTRKGVDHVIVDKTADHVQQSRALVMHPRTLEILEVGGVTEKLVNTGVKAAGFSIHVDDRHAVNVNLKGEDSSTPFPFSLIVEQSCTERLLLQELESLGTTVHRPIAVWKIDGLQTKEGEYWSPDSSTSVYNNGAQCGPSNQDEPYYKSRSSASSNGGESLHSDGEETDADGDYPVTVHLRAPVAQDKSTEGDFYTCKCKYIIGCDGVRSVTRKSSGIPFIGESYPSKFTVADVRAESTCHMSNDRLNGFFSAKGMLLIFPLTENRWRLVIAHPEVDTSPSDSTANVAPDIKALQKLTYPILPALKIKEVCWSSSYKIIIGLANTMKSGRSILVGDAGHVHSPVGGQGMNLGIQDAHNLAWKLAAVLNDRANWSILESYNEERHQIAESIVRNTTRVFFAILGQTAVPRPWARWFLSYAAPYVFSTEFFSHRLIRMVSMLSHTYHANGTLVGEQRLGLTAIQPGSRAPDALVKATKLGNCKLPNAEPKYLFDYLQGGHHTLLLCISTLPLGSKLRNWFGCDTPHLACRFIRHDM